MLYYIRKRNRSASFQGSVIRLNSEVLNPFLRAPKLCPGFWCGSSTYKLYGPCGWHLIQHCIRTENRNQDSTLRWSNLRKNCYTDNIFLIWLVSKFYVRLFSLSFWRKKKCIRIILYVHLIFYFNQPTQLNMLHVTQAI